MCIFTHLQKDLIGTASREKLTEFSVLAIEVIWENEYLVLKHYPHVW